MIMEPQAYEELHLLEPSHWWYQGMRHITDRLLRRHLPRQHGLLILDAGCGVGGNLSAFSTFGTVFGFDYSPLALGYAQEQHQGDIARASVEAIPFPTGTFDFVTSLDVLCVREVGDDQRAIHELARVTRPGSHVLMRLPAWSALRGPHDTFVHGVRRYTARDLNAKLASAGLLPVRMTYANSLLMPLIFVTRKLQSLRLGAGGSSSDVSPTPAPVNRLLTLVLDLEAQWIASGRGFPAGVSIFCLARKQPADFSAENQT
jgi:SAM-dependent methyltransferase